MVAAAELENLDRAPASLILQRVAQDDHVVGDEFLDPKARNWSVIIRSLGGQHSGDAHPFQG